MSRNNRICSFLEKHFLAKNQFLFPNVNDITIRFNSITIDKATAITFTK
jgi:hypothetical protein